MRTTNRALFLILLSSALEIARGGDASSPPPLPIVPNGPSISEFVDADSSGDVYEFQSTAGNLYRIDLTHIGGLQIKSALSDESESGWQMTEAASEVGKDLSFIFQSKNDVKIKIAVSGYWGGSSGPYTITLKEGAAAADRFATTPKKKDAFGAAVAADSSVIVVGAPGRNVGGAAKSGAVEVLDAQDPNTPTIATLTSPVIVPGAKFGAAVAVANGWIAVGSPRDRIASGKAAGTVHLFHFESGAWVHRQTLESPDGNSKSAFGSCLAIAGSRLFVGAPGASAKCGSVYVYSLVENGALLPATAIVPSAAEPHGQFGYSLASSGGLLVVGAPGAIDQRGRAFVFSNATGSWLESAMLQPAESSADQAGARFGESVAVDGLVLIGAPGYDDGTIPYPAQYEKAGRIYTFGPDLVRGGFIAATIEPYSCGGRCGSAVALSNGLIAIGAPYRSTTPSLDVDSSPLGEAGGAMLRRVDVEAPEFDMGEDAIPFTSSKPQTLGHFGKAIAFTGKLIVVGSPDTDFDPTGAKRKDAGSIRVFRLP